MKAVVLRRHGRPSVLGLSEAPDPRPGPGEVRVRVRAIGVNFAEVLSRRGLYGWAPPLPYVLGMEAFGEIDAVGDGVSGRHPGERVIAGMQHGAYAELACVPEHQALSAIPGFSDDENAAFAVSFMTAWIALVEMARLRPSDHVLVQAAAGGVGTAAVQLAKAFGCTVYGAVGSAAKLPLVQRLGADHAIDYGRSALDTELRRLTAGRGVDVVLELVGGDVHRRSVAALAPFGRVVVTGFASLDLRRLSPASWLRTWRDLPRADVRDLAARSHGILASHLGYLLPDRERVRRVWSELTAFVTAHGLRPVVGHVVPWHDVASAHELMQSRRSTGKIVMRVVESAMPPAS